MAHGRRASRAPRWRKPPLNARELRAETGRVLSWSRWRMTQEPNRPVPGHAVRRDRGWLSRFCSRCYRRGLVRRSGGRSGRRPAPSPARGSRRRRGAPRVVTFFLWLHRDGGTSHLGRLVHPVRPLSAPPAFRGRSHSSTRAPARTTPEAECRRAVRHDGPRLETRLTPRRQSAEASDRSTASRSTARIVGKWRGVPPTLGFVIYTEGPAAKAVLHTLTYSARAALAKLTPAPAVPAGWGWLIADGLQFAVPSNWSVDHWARRLPQLGSDGPLWMQPNTVLLYSGGEPSITGMGIVSAGGGPRPHR